MASLWPTRDRCERHVCRGREYSDFVNVAGMGAVTTKGVSLNGWEGNESPRIAETPSGMLNSIGLQNPGVKHLCEVDLPWLKSQGVPAIVNVSGHSLEEYVSVVEALEEDGQADAYEINISCPNVDAGGLTFGTHVPSVERVVSACREAATKPMIVKLTPNVTDITEIAKAAEASGADAISLINTLLGMAIDARHAQARARSRGGRPFRPRCETRCFAHGVAVPQRGEGSHFGHGRHFHCNRRGGIHARRRYRRGRWHRELHQSPCGRRGYRRH